MNEIQVKICPHCKSTNIGIGYQLVFFIICMVLAVKLFSSDKILTLKINFGKKRAVAGKKRTGLLGK